ncbi:YdeI family protein [Sphingomonas sp. LHG3406-1]|uniref:YdeI/OmpD-associated family protein n=1 Tax=Sphingomonas sp. LHG3406-1 TaxID=2804617 RepID=UPI0026035126|nr:YdeI/OmpD-associated family protein [Sphingomonas sp. LHG3406-1]
MGEEIERGGLPILHFADAAALEAWLEEQPVEHKGVWLKIAKKDRGVSSVSVPEAIDAGLCFGWIDGLINRFDEDFYLIRYTPRRPRSKWSEINARRAEALQAAGRVRPGGLSQIEAAKTDGRWDSAYPPASRMEVPADLAAALAERPAAKVFFDGLKGANRYAVLYRLHDVRDPAKRKAAVAKAVAKLERGETAYD